jgi:hypothetical protein
MSLVMFGKSCISSGVKEVAFSSSAIQSVNPKRISSKLNQLEQKFLERDTEQRG